MSNFQGVKGINGIFVRLNSLCGELQAHAEQNEKSREEINRQILDLTETIRREIAAAEAKQLQSLAEQDKQIKDLKLSFFEFKFSAEEKQRILTEKVKDLERRLSDLENPKHIL